MKALTHYQPYASGLILKIKGPETRSWKTNYRGIVAIHAAKAMPQWAMEFAQTERALGIIPNRLPLGCILGTAVLIDCQPTQIVAPTLTPIQRLWGNYSYGRWAWLWADIKPFDEPIVARGAQRLWEWKETGT